MTSSSAITPERATAPRLERLLQPLQPAELDLRPGGGEPAWLRAGAWRLLARPGVAAGDAGEPIERFALPSGETVDAVRTAEGTVVVPFDPDEAYANYVTEAWRDNARVHALGTSQLRLYYRIKRLLPREFWLSARRAFIRLGKTPEFPAWPLEDGVDRLLRFSALCNLLAADVDEAPFAWFWPEAHHAALILTHDVESAEGLRLAIELADLEEERGLRSSFNVVGAQYDVDYGILRELGHRGFEVGLHGLYHDRSLFSSREEFERQLPGLGEAAERFGAVGFRSPATYRVLDWLEELPADYDCSVPHSDPYEPQPGGCCSVWPFLLGRIVELPYTLPQDHTLFTLLRDRSADRWLRQVDAIERRFGLIQCLSHPDPGYLGDPDKRTLYRDFLDAVAERPGLWKALPREVADWWRRRDEGGTTAPEQLHGTMRRGAASEYATLAPPGATASRPSRPDSSPSGQ
jgi:peptidoglycan/xylan/chitin deacetylase (PgdA/CDA1 family)